MIDEETKRLVKLLKIKTANRNLCDILNISNVVLTKKLDELGKKGFFIKKSYTSNGIIYYKLLNSSEKIKEYKKEPLRIEHTTKDPFKFLAISDLHIGNELETKGEIEKVFNYCKKHNIHVIFCCGDMVDGTFTKGRQRIKDPYQQIDYFIKSYPVDPSIITVAVGGDHDKSILYEYYQDIIEVLKQARKDIIIEEYGSYPVKIKEDQILLYHYINGQDFVSTRSSLILQGHSHQYAARVNKQGTLNIYVPALSKVNSLAPSALEVTTDFKGNLFNYVSIKQIEFKPDPVIINEEGYQLTRNKHFIKQKTL